MGQITATRNVDFLPNWPSRVIFFQHNVFEIVWKMEAISFIPQYKWFDWIHIFHLQIILTLLFHVKMSCRYLWMAVRSAIDFEINHLVIDSCHWSKATLTWWHHQMEAFSASLAFCEGNSPVTGEFPSQRPVTQSFDIFFDLHLNKWLSKPSRRWWFETSSCSL